MEGERIEKPKVKEPGRFLGRTLSMLRWIILAAMLLITLLWPLSDRFGAPVWRFVLLFMGYNLVVELLRARVPRLRSFTWVPFVDLPITGLIYYFDAEPGGPLFPLFYLSLVTAAVTLGLRLTVLYTGAVLLLLGAIAPTLPLWTPTPRSVRELSARMVVMALVGIGTALLTRRLILEREMAHASRREAERLDELERLRADFVSSVSHDLQTPLTAAKAGMGMLESSLAHNHLAPEQERLLENIRRNIERLGIHVEDLLTYNQIEAGALQLDMEPLDLRVVAKESLGTIRPLIETKSQTLRVELPEPLPAMGDRWRIEQAIVNLLSNANRHTPPGTRIVLSGAPSEEGVHLSVRDNGPGVPEAEMEAIFQRFHRLVDDTNGMGLGLAIARAIIELHGGELWGESRVGEGTTFHIMLPRRAEEERLTP